MENNLEHACYEVSIPVPWGHIAGRWYGDQTQRPILALHGWQDNCGSFAKLAPLIAPYRSLLCIDLPGHGLSSHLPIGIIYHNMDYVRVIIRIMQIYKWKKVSLMGHSMGGGVSFHFAAIFPDSVDMIISLDIIKNLHYPPEVMPKVLQHIFEKLLNYNDRLDNGNSSRPPCYTFKECEQLLNEATLESVDLENCKYILERNISKAEFFPEKYYFSRDNRIKQLMELNPNMEMAKAMAKRICKVSLPYLVIRGGGSTNISAKPTELDEYLMLNNRNFESHIYPGGSHHLHLNNAEPVSKLVINFLEKHNKPAEKHFQAKL